MVNYKLISIALALTLLSTIFTGAVFAGPLVEQSITSLEQKQDVLKNNPITDISSTVAQPVKDEATITTCFTTTDTAYAVEVAAFAKMYHYDESSGVTQEAFYEEQLRSYREQVVSSAIAEEQRQKPIPVYQATS